MILTRVAVDCRVWFLYAMAENVLIFVIHSFLATMVGIAATNSSQRLVRMSGAAPVTAEVVPTSQREVAGASCETYRIVGWAVG